MQLEIQLADPRGEVVGLPFRAVEEIGRAGQLDLRRTIDAPQPVSGFDHVRLRTTSPIPPPVEVERERRPNLVFEICGTPDDLPCREVAVVRVRRREVREDCRPVDAFPHEGVVRRLVGVVPRELLGQEILSARLGDELRQ